MIEKNGLSKDNQGSTLLMVILCVAFISILGSIVVSATVSNLKMKKANQKAKTNFYETEMALDEIKTGLEEVTAQAASDAYKKVLENYITISEEEKKNLFAKAFIDGLAEKLGGESNAAIYSTEYIASFIKQSPARLSVPLGKNTLIKDTSNLETPKFITLTNVKVTYKDANNFQTSISTDITINTPSMDFRSAHKLQPVYADFGLIANQKIDLNASPSVIVKGNVYSGNGGIILQHGSELTMDDADRIITRGNIEVAERSQLTIKNYPALWTRNIATLKGADTDNPTSIKINAKTYVADDFMLNAKNSDVILEGEYYGYSYSSTIKDNAQDGHEEKRVEAQDSSAIIINGRNTSLNMERVNKLFIAGRAVLNPNSAGNHSAMDQGNVYTGEALAIKGNQVAYLVPAEAVWTGTNPVTLENYNSRPSHVAEVDYGKVSDHNLKLSNYVDGYSKIFYQAGSQEFVYYYLKFQSEEKANQYLQKYYEVYNAGEAIGIIDNRLKPYAKKIALGNSVESILSAGNIFTLNNAGKSSLLANTINPDSSTDGNLNPGLELLRLTSANLAERYDSVQQNLIEYAKVAPYNSDSIFDTIIHTENLRNDALTDPEFIDGVKRVIEATDSVVYIIDNKDGEVFHLQADTSLPNYGMKGIVIATGSVRVSGNFTGLIIAGDTITLHAGAKVTASKKDVEELFNLRNPKINRYFRNLSKDIQDEIEGGSGKVDISKLIVFDNWKKNKSLE